MQKRQRDDSDAVGRRVAAHYNARNDQGIDGRVTSKIFHLRAFNNFVKSTLINRYVRGGLRVLDIACGKGGDIGKWARHRVSKYVGVDIAAASIEQAQARLGDARWNVNAEFHVLDCFAKHVETVLVPGSHGSFDMVSTQFALHYAFQNEEKARIAINNVAWALKPGGIWIGTVPNSNWIVKKLRTTTESTISNEHYQITSVFDKVAVPRFGAEYVFHLEDAIDDCPEYLVHWPTLCRLAEVAGLRCILRMGFHDWFYDRVAEHEGRDLVYRMNVLTQEGTMSEAEWEVAGVYIVFAFEKGDVQRI